MFVLQNCLLTEGWLNRELAILCFLFIVNVDCSQDLQGQVATGEEELGQVKRQAEETEGNLRQTVDQLIEVRLSFVLFNSMSPLMAVK